MGFNTTGDRDVRTLLLPLSKLDLDLVVFCSNKSGQTENVDQQNFTTNARQQLARSVEQLHCWTKIQSEDSPAYLSARHTVPCINIPCINDALLWLTQGRDPLLIPDPAIISNQQNPEVPLDLVSADQVQLLVTGSLHLVGGVLGCLEPSLAGDENSASPKTGASHTAGDNIESYRSQTGLKVGQQNGHITARFRESANTA